MSKHHGRDNSDRKSKTRTERYGTKRACRTMIGGAGGGTDDYNVPESANIQKKKINIKLNNEQLDAIEVVKRNAVTFLIGAAGTGKTLTAVKYALTNLIAGSIDNIYVVRPIISDKNEGLGFLPGTIEEKMAPWIEAIIGNMVMLVGEYETRRLTSSGEVAISSLEHMRGITFNNSVVIVDEAQNLTPRQLEKVTTRLGRINSKIIICGDIRQSDLPETSMSGLNSKLLDFLTKRPHVGLMELTINNRHPVVKHILEAFDDYYAYINGSEKKIGNNLTPGLK